MYNYALGALAVVQALAFLHLSFGVVYAPAVMKAYDAISGEGTNIMFVLALFGILCSKGVLAAAQRKFLPKWFWSDWKKNLGLMCVYLAASAIFAAYLWFGFSTGFFQNLDKAWVYVALTAVTLVVFMAQALYWALLFPRNWRGRS